MNCWIEFKNSSAFAADNRLDWSEQKSYNILENKVPEPFGLRETGGYGGIGRRVGFRCQWVTVWVQVPLAAVKRQ